MKTTLLTLWVLLAGTALAQEDGPLPPPIPDAPLSGTADPLAPEPEPSPAPTTTGPEEGFQVRVSQILTHQDMHRWERHVRGFRREHNFAISAGVSQGTWDVTWADEAEGKEFDNTGIYSRFQYSFHLQLYKGFGYILGSGVGYHYETADRRREFRPVPAYQFPGLLVGLVLNVNPVVRFSAAFEAYLERHNGIERRLAGTEPTEIHVTMQAYDGGLYADVFYDLSWALRVEGHVRHLEYLRPKSGDETYPVDARLHKDDRWVGVGLVYHLL